ncbi:hypothetical protein ACUV84_040550 [Puccinellia chinampoensis]
MHTLSRATATVHCRFPPLGFLAGYVEGGGPVLVLAQAGRECLRRDIGGAKVAEGAGGAILVSLDQTEADVLSSSPEAELRREVAVQAAQHLRQSTSH